MNKNNYPEVKIENKNKEYANILSNNYAGIISEETAVHEYIYQHIILLDKNKKLSDALLKISMTEMRHSSILGNLINILGSKPKFNAFNYFSKNKIPWNPNYINYTTSEKEILEHNIKSEQLAIEQYKKTISLINDKYIIDIINKIIEDELEHIKIFKSFQNKKIE